MKIEFENFILDSRVDGGGDFIHREVIQTPPEGKRSQKMGQHKSFQISHIAMDGRDLPSALPQREAFAAP